MDIVHGRVTYQKRLKQKEIYKKHVCPGSYNKNPEAREGGGVRNWGERSEEGGWRRAGRGMRREKGG